jgi:hypothetical protein
MKLVLLRVGADSGCRPIHANGPLLPDGRFELVPIPDHLSIGESRTYSNTPGRYGRPLADYFPDRRLARANLPMHVDPEFESFTYGSPTSMQRSLVTLEQGDMLVFYGGLRPVDDDGSPVRGVPHALYLFGYFEVDCAVRAREYTREELLQRFGANFHVRHPDIFERQHHDLVLVKGSIGSRLLTTAVQISERQPAGRGRPTFVLSEDMRQVFGPLSGMGSIERSAPRWIEPEFSPSAAQYVRSLR